MSEANAASSSRTSLDMPTNGVSSDAEEDDGPRRSLSTMSADELRSELARTTGERDTYLAQYQSLLSKLTSMRATLGDRLRQDAEELDRREAQIETLTSQLETLQTSSTTLREELVSSHSEVDRLTSELDSLRKTLAATESQPSRTRERELYELLERSKLDAASWQSACLEEQSKREQLETQLVEARDEVERARSSEHQQRAVARREAASAAELSAVLAEFQSSQESELAKTLADYETRVEALEAKCSEWKGRAEVAEGRLESAASVTAQAESLAAQVKEKNLLIGKLRHEAVILNEHLTEALRRLRNDQSEANVDKRLVSNLLVKFLTTPRTDGKRYEMLRLMAGVLGWGEAEREAVGLVRSGAARPGGGTRKVSNGAAGGGGGGGGAAGGADESFGNLFVEFLLSEAESGKGQSEGEAERERSAPGTPGTPVPSRLAFSPTRDTFRAAGADGSPGKSEPGNTPVKDGSGGGGLGSYFGLSRGGGKK